MPITKSAIKKLKQDNNREKVNLLAKENLRKTIKKFRQKPDSKLLSQVYSLLDKARKKKIFHANKVARLKSSMAKLLAKKSVKKATTSSSNKKKSTKKTK